MDSIFLTIWWCQVVRNDFPLFVTRCRTNSKVETAVRSWNYSLTVPNPDPEPRPPEERDQIKGPHTFELSDTIS